MDIETRRKKQRALMRRAVERKVRSRAQQIYESRGQAEGRELQDWFQAEAEVLENRMLATVYRHVIDHSERGEKDTATTQSSDQADLCETTT